MPIVIYNDPFAVANNIFEMRNKRHEVAKKKRRKRKLGNKVGMKWIGSWF